MYNKRGDKELIIDMFLACEKILEYTEGFTEDTFREYTKTYDAVVRNLEILGEAVKNISKDFRKKYPDIKWDKIASYPKLVEPSKKFRQDYPELKWSERTKKQLAYVYFGLVSQMVWDTIKKHIPTLHSKLKKIIDENNWNYEL